MINYILLPALSENGSVYEALEYNINNKPIVIEVRLIKSMRTKIVLLLLRKHFYDAAKSTSC